MSCPKTYYQDKCQTYFSLYFLLRVYRFRSYIFVFSAFWVFVYGMKWRFNFHSFAYKSRVIPHHWKDVSHCTLLTVLSKTDWLCMWEFILGSLFCCFSLCIYFYAHSILFGLLQPFNIVWNPGFWYLQPYSSPPKIAFIVEDICVGSHANVKIMFSISVKHVSGIWIATGLNNDHAEQYRWFLFCCKY